MKHTFNEFKLSTSLQRQRVIDKVENGYHFGTSSNGEIVKFLIDKSNKSEPMTIMIDDKQRCGVDKYGEIVSLYVVTKKMISKESVYEL